MQPEIERAIRRAYPTGEYAYRQKNYERRGTYKERDDYAKSVTPGYCPSVLIRKIKKELVKWPDILLEPPSNWDYWPDRVCYQFKIYPTNMWRRAPNESQQWRRFLMLCEISQILPIYLCRWFLATVGKDSLSYGPCSFLGRSSGRFRPPSKFWKFIEQRLDSTLQSQGLKRFRDIRQLREPVRWLKPATLKFLTLWDERGEAERAQDAAEDSFGYYPPTKTLKVYHCFFF